MGLYGEYFSPIIDGKKKIEVRLFDEKRRKIKVSDKIEFIKVPELDEQLQVTVTDLMKYDSFQEMYEDIPFEEFGTKGWTLEEMLKGTYEIYTPEQEKKWGVLAIKIKY